MTENDKRQNLISLCRKQDQAFKSENHKTYRNIDYNEDPELYFLGFDYDNYQFLKNKNLVNSGICHECGFTPITNEFSFIQQRDARLKFSICYQCWKDKQINVKNLAKTTKCYIATVCYQEEQSKELTFFRNFRDNNLNSNFAGRMFVKLYYFCSPNIANFLSTKPRLNLLVKRVLLNPLYNFLNKAK